MKTYTFKIDISSKILTALPFRTKRLCAFLFSAVLCLPGALQADPTVNILFLFNSNDSGVTDVTTPGDTDVDALVTALNTAIKASGIYASDVFVKVGYEQHAWTWASDVQEDLKWAKNGTNDYGTINTKRTTAQADIVCLMGNLPNPQVRSGMTNIDIDTLLGIATAYQGVKDVKLGYVFLDLQNIKRVSGTYATNLAETFVHEIGHIVGANHEEKQVHDDSQLTYLHGFQYKAATAAGDDNYGYVDKTNKWKSIMSYAFDCATCVASPILFSDPARNVTAKTYKSGINATPAVRGSATVTPVPAKKATNNAKTVKAIIAIVATYL